jgi:hypothetical protein
MKLYEVLIRLKDAGSVFPRDFRHTVKQNDSVLFSAVATEGHSDIMELCERWSIPVRLPRAIDRMTSGRSTGKERD